MLRAAIALAIFSVSVLGCHRSGSTPPSALPDGGVGPVATSDSGAPAVVEPAPAAEDDEGEAMRVADRDGTEALSVRLRSSKDPKDRLIAAIALGFSDDQSVLADLADVAGREGEPLARAAVEAIVRIAAAKRTQTDPEDAVLLREGVDKTLALARDTKRPKSNRILAVSALRMFADRGLVAADAIPTDVDAK